VRGLILVPTGELVRQLNRVLRSVVRYCNDVKTSFFEFCFVFSMRIFKAQNNI
jgi:superfamily II DNA/RNA helicase